VKSRVITKLASIIENGVTYDSDDVSSCKDVLCNTKLISSFVHFVTYVITEMASYITLFFVKIRGYSFSDVNIYYSRLDRRHAFKM